MSQTRRETKEATLLRVVTGACEQATATIIAQLGENLDNVDARTVLHGLHRAQYIGIIAIASLLFHVKYDSEAATYGTSWSSLYACELTRCG